LHALKVFTAMNRDDFQDQEANVPARVQHDTHPTHARSQGHRAVAAHCCARLDCSFVGCLTANESDVQALAQPQQRRFLPGLKASASAPEMR